MNIDKFLKIEKKYNLYTQKVHGVSFWMYTRFHLWNEIICANIFDTASAHPIPQKNWKNSLSTIYTLLINSITHNHIPRKDYDICFSCHERRIKRNNFYECCYTEKLSEKFENSITLEKPFKFKHLKPTHNKNIIYTDNVLICGELSNRFHQKLRTKKYKSLYQEVKEIIQAPISDIENAYETKIDLDTICRLCVKEILIVSTERKLYNKLIETINPKIIVETVYYCDQCMIINEIAAKKGITTIELQHGAIHDKHSAYRFDTEQNLIQLPRIVLTFSQYWNQVIKMPQGYTTLISTGFPHFEEQLNAFQNMIRERNGIKNILFISQGTIFDPLSKLAVDLDKLIVPDAYHIIYKLHPSEFADAETRCQCFHNTNISVMADTNTDLYTLFAKSTVQVGVYSTAIYEGLGFNLETYIYDIAYSDTMDTLIQTGYAHFVHSAAELYAMIQETRFKEIDVDSLWKKDSFHNIAAVLAEELEKRNANQTDGSKHEDSYRKTKR